MPDIATTAVTPLLAAAAQQGPGDTLRIVLLGSMVGAVLLAWFLLRGYRKDRDTEPGGPGEGAGTGRAENGPGDANA
ncbi:hypothetical protein [Streptomyces sp. NPDC090025]|uniref:hypothetical protein n=1 Tax=Streptomyces sp. NPDC090025 TaxID=3365922 RepID=UPI003833F210